MKSEFDYNQYCKDLDDASDAISLRKSIRTERKGAKGIRDRLVFFRAAWSAAETWASLPHALVYWLALTPLAITSYNGFMEIVGLNFLKIPIEFGSVLAVAFVSALMIFGFFAWTTLGLRRRQNDLNNKQQPIFLLIHKELKELKNEIKELKKEKNKC